jgi:hypothetical protein
MQTPEFKARQEASAIVSQMLLLIVRLLLEGYDRNGEHIGAVWPELMIGMTIRLNDDRGHAPISQLGIVRATGMPRGSVQRWLDILVEQHVVKKSGPGYICDARHLQERLNSRHFKRIVRAIRAAARLLKDYE